jgi:hypothetical protein
MNGKRKFELPKTEEYAKFQTRKFHL